MINMQRQISSSSSSKKGLMGHILKINDEKYKNLFNEASPSPFSAILLLLLICMTFKQLEQFID